MKIASRRNVFVTVRFLHSLYVVLFMFLLQMFSLSLAANQHSKLICNGRTNIYTIYTDGEQLGLGMELWRTLLIRFHEWYLKNWAHCSMTRSGWRINKKIKVIFPLNSFQKVLQVALEPNGFIIRKSEFPSLFLLYLEIMNEKTTK